MSLNPDALTVDEPKSVVDRFKSEMTERLKGIERAITENTKARDDAARKVRELKTERDEINRTLKAMVKRTRSKS